MDYIRTKYWTVFPKQLQDNDIAFDAKWDPTTPITVIFTRIEEFNKSAKAGEYPFTEKGYFDIHTFPSKTLDCSTWHVIPGETIPQALKSGVTSSSSLPKRQPTSNMKPLNQSASMMNLPMLYYNLGMHSQHNSKKFQTCAIYRNNRWTAPQNTRTSEPK